MQKTLLAVLALLLFAGAASAQEHTFRIPFREVNHRILVDVKVDDRPATLLFDTGARASVLLGTVGYDLQLHLKHGKFFSGGETNVAFQKAEVKTQKPARRTLALAKEKR